MLYKVQHYLFKLVYIQYLYLFGHLVCSSIFFVDKSCGSHLFSSLQSVVQNVGYKEKVYNLKHCSK